MGHSRNDPESQIGTDAPPATRDVHDNLTAKPAIDPGDRKRGNDMRTSVMGSSRQAVGANPIRWAGWLAGLAISIAFWFAIYWLWTSA